jgi:hypothetical protein
LSLSPSTEKTKLKQINKKTPGFSHAVFWIYGSEFHLREPSLDASYTCWQVIQFLDMSVSFLVMPSINDHVINTNISLLLYMLLFSFNYFVSEFAWEAAVESWMRCKMAQPEDVLVHSANSFLTWYLLAGLCGDFNFFDSQPSVLLTSVLGFSSERKEFHSLGFFRLLLELKLLPIAIGNSPMPMCFVDGRSV